MACLRGGIQFLGLPLTGLWPFHAANESELTSVAMSTYIRNEISHQDLPCKELQDAGESPTEMDVVKNERRRWFGLGHGGAGDYSYSIDGLKL